MEGSKALQLIAAFEQAVLKKAEVDSRGGTKVNYPQELARARNEAVRVANDLFHALTGHSPCPKELERMIESVA